MTVAAGFNPNGFADQPNDPDGLLGQVEAEIPQATQRLIESAEHITGLDRVIPEPVQQSALHAMDVATQRGVNTSEVKLAIAPLALAAWTAFVTPVLVRHGIAVPADWVQFSAIGVAGVVAGAVMAARTWLKAKVFSHARAILGR